MPDLDDSPRLVHLQYNKQIGLGITPLKEVEFTCKVKECNITFDNCGKKCETDSCHGSWLLCGEQMLEQVVVFGTLQYPHCTEQSSEEWHNLLHWLGP